MIGNSAAKAQRHGPVRGSAALALALAASTVAAPAVAGGFFDALFGGPAPAPYSYPTERPEPAPRSLPAPKVESSATAAATTGRAFCVRLCDGRYYPIGSAAKNSTPVQMCSAMCPAAKTAVFRGGEIAGATDTNGNRYSKLDQAFAYRKSTVPDCTCNGKDPYGLVSIDLAADPTLRSGDLIATGAGVKPYQGSRNALSSTVASGFGDHVSVLSDPP